MKKLLAVILLSFSFVASAQQLNIALLKYRGGGDWYGNPTSLPNLVRFCNQEIGTDINPNVPTVEPSSPDLFNYPYVYMTGHGNVVFDAAEAQNLRNYMLAGGFLHIDDNYGIRQYIEPQMKKVFPELDFVELPYTHEIFKKPYAFPNGLPKIHAYRMHLHLRMRPRRRLGRSTCAPRLARDPRESPQDGSEYLAVCVYQIELIN